MKNKTHIYMANMLIEDIKANRINLPGLGTFTPPAEVRSAIMNHPAAFRAGSVGPDFYPDVPLGQAVIHPENSGQWLELMFNRLLLSVPSEREKNLAFTLGYMTHYAGDMFGHAYVNSYAKGWFPPYKEILKSDEKAKIVIRHMLVETYMDKLVPPSASMQLSPPIDFIVDVFTCDEAQQLMRKMRVNDDYTNPLGKFINLRKNVHSDLLTTWIGLAPGVTKYVQNWEEDVEAGIRSWIEAWAQTSNIFAGSSSGKLSRTMDLFEEWFIKKFISMIGVPDFVGKVLSFLNSLNILKPLKDLIKDLAKEVLISLAKALLGETFTTIEAVIAAIEKVFKDPRTYLDNGMVFDEKNVSKKLDTDFGNYGKEISSDRQEFLAVRRCLNMSKLCLVGTDNLNDIVRKASGNISFRSTEFAPAARMGHITVRTSGTPGAGTDNNVYIGIRYGDGRKYEVLCDKAGYNDFEMRDVDTYPFFVPENIDLSGVRSITARMSGHTPAGDWKCDWIEIKDRSKNVLFRADDDFWLSTGNEKSITNISRKYSVTGAPLRMDPTIISSLWSLDGKGWDDSNPARNAQWELGFPLYTDAALREKVFCPLFEMPFDPSFALPSAHIVPVIKGSRYYVNRNFHTQRDGSIHHEVHKETCSNLPKSWNRLALGIHETAASAMAAAREKMRADVDGCYYCCNEFHTK